MIHCLVIYDISDDRVRGRVADACLDYGLKRLQESAFGGPLSAVHQRELLVLIRQRVGREACNVQLFALDETSWQSRRTIEQERKKGQGSGAGNRGDGDKTAKPGGRSNGGASNA